VRGGEGFGLARDILDSGRALAKMEAIIDAQGRRPFDPDRPGLASKAFEVAADRDGVVTAIDNLRLSRLARLSGAPKVRGAGVDLFRKSGDAVSRGDPLYRVHAEYGSDLAFARQWSAHDSGYAIGEPGETPREFSEF
jgi:thymidine phosphorylase